jgi:hypothetical protein
MCIQLHSDGGTVSQPGGSNKGAWIQCAAFVCWRRSGRPSTDKAALKALVSQHPLPGIILRFRKLSKNMSEMHARMEDAAAAEAAAAASAASRGTAAAAAEAVAAATGLVRVHSSWLQTCHASGRLSSGVKSGDGSEGTSLQCVANDMQFELHSEVTAAQGGAGVYADSDSDDASDCDGEREGTKAVMRPAAQPAAAATATGAAVIAPVAAGSGAGAVSAPAAAAAAAAGDRAAAVQARLCTASVRSGFVAPAGCVILGAHYCQMEFRLMAHFSGDKSLLQVGFSGAFVGFAVRYRITRSAARPQTRPVLPHMLEAAVAEMLSG